MIDRVPATNLKSQAPPALVRFLMLLLEKSWKPPPARNARPNLEGGSYLVGAGAGCVSSGTGAGTGSTTAGTTATAGGGVSSGAGGGAAGSASAGAAGASASAEASGGLHARKVTVRPFAGSCSATSSPRPIVVICVASTP